MGTLLDSFQSYGATRSRSPVPQAAVSGKRDSSSVAAVWAILIFSSRDDRPKIVCKTRILSTPPQTQLYYVKLHFCCRSLLFAWCTQVVLNRVSHAYVSCVLSRLNMCDCW